MSWLTKLLAVTLVLALVSSAQIHAQGKAAEKADEKGKAQQVPQAVTDALKKLAKESPVDVETKGKEDARRYEAEWQADGKAHEAILNAAGNVLYTKDEVDSKEVPKAVQDAAMGKANANATLKYTVIRLNKGDKTFYEVAAIAADKKQELFFAADGSPVDEDDTEYVDDEEGED